MNATRPTLKKNPPILWAVAFIIFLGQHSIAASPKAISLDYCADQYLLALGNEKQIIALSNFATSQPSFYAKRAEQLKKININAEEILTINPDVVLATDSAFAVLPTLQRYDIRVIKTGFGHDRKTFYQNIENFGRALERRPRADAIIEDYKKRVTILEQLPRQNIKVAYITPSGYTGGGGTFVNDIIKLAGFNSLAEENEIIGWQPLSLELLFINPPDLIITSFFDQKDVHISHWSLSRHPKIKQMINEIPTISVPSNLLSCNGQFSIEAAEFIHRSAIVIMQEDIK